MKKFLVVFVTTLVAVVLVLGGGFAIKRNHEKERAAKLEIYEQLIAENKFPNKTTLNVGNIKLDISNLTTNEVYENYLREKGDVIFRIILNGTEYPIILSEYFRDSVVLDSVNNLLKELTFEQFLETDTYELVLESNIITDYEKIKESLNTFLENVEYKYVVATDASFDKETCSIIPEVYGTELDKKVCVEKMIANLKNNKYSINLDNNEFYIAPKKIEKDFEKLYKNYSDVYNWEASYIVSDYVISMQDYLDYVIINDDDTVDVDTSFMKSAVLALSKTIDKVGTARKFNSTVDGEIVVVGGTYGQVMNNNEEIEYLIEKLEKRETVTNREPIWKVEPKEEGYENTYIEIDLSEQHVWYYKDNELVMDSNCVTGTKGTSRATPTGFYFVSEKIDGKYLIGPGYKSWVDKWMRITDRGHGLHDAQWRKASEFNNKTYTYDGSHGCINLPKQFAYDLYDAIDVGILVVVHD